MLKDKKWFIYPDIYGDYTDGESSAWNGDFVPNSAPFHLKMPTLSCRGGDYSDVGVTNPKTTGRTHFLSLFTVRSSLFPLPGRNFSPGETRRVGTETATLRSFFKNVTGIKQISQDNARLVHHWASFSPPWFTKEINQEPKDQCSPALLRAKQALALTGSRWCATLWFTAASPGVQYFLWAGLLMEYFEYPVQDFTRVPLTGGIWCV